MKFLSTIVAFLLATTAVHAQDYLLEDDDYMFNHMSLGLTAGTAGVGLDLAMPLTKYITVRAGATYMPTLKMTTDLERVAYEGAKGEEAKQVIAHSQDPRIPLELGIKSTPNFFNGKLMFDFYASPSFPLHLTLGAYFGNKQIMKFESIDNEETFANDYYQYNSRLTSKGIENSFGVLMGNYTLVSDKEGKLDAWIETQSIRPYVGLGWGNAISEKGIDWMVEAGVIYWGKPNVYCNTTIDGNPETIKREEGDLCGTKAPILKFLTKSSIYPVINFRLNFNMF
ncbi:MAG: hypothetical protein IKQ72_07670 [Bacteroidaceae bacterium]|nr:hypothetical protein [Bacteroidaceae bacterium]